MAERGRIFVTGGNGFLGSAVVRRLCDAGYGVRCLLRPGSDTRRIDDLPVDRVPGDLREGASLAPALAGCSGVLHLASIASWSALDSPELEAVVVEGTRRVLAAARSAGELRTVLVSSAAAINGTATPLVQDESAAFTLDPATYRYAAAKHRAEGLAGEAVASGLPVVTVNPAEIYGPRDTGLVTSGNLLSWIRSWPTLVVAGGTSVAHVDDVAAGVVAAYERGRVGERYFLGGENLTLRALAQLTLRLAGEPRRRVVCLPRAPVRRIAALAGRTGLPLPFPPAAIAYASLYWFFTAAKAERELEVRFRSAADTLADTVAWLREAGHLPPPR